MRCLAHEDAYPVTNEDDQTANSSVTEVALKHTNKVLGVLTGLLAAALVVVTVGWIVSCVYWQRRITQR